MINLLESNKSGTFIVMSINISNFSTPLFACLKTQLVFFVPVQGGLLLLVQGGLLVPVQGGLLVLGSDMKFL